MRTGFLKKKVDQVSFSFSAKNRQSLVTTCDWSEIFLHLTVQSEHKNMEATGTMNRFYQLLGKVFYEAAHVDGNLRDEEQKRLKEVVKTDWVILEDSVDQYGSDAAFQIEFMFDILFETAPKMPHILEELDLFRQKHPELFTPEMNRRIVGTAGKITACVNGKNKQELVFLSQLESLLKNQN